MGRIEMPKALTSRKAPTKEEVEEYREGLKRGIGRTLKQPDRKLQEAVETFPCELTNGALPSKTDQFLMRDLEARITTEGSIVGK